MPSSAVYCKL
uniref:Uncharacterized protein n=1 Tax=Rhizophora mucronata TaxID=61149 RepID=A0A2P2QQ25_RHIMU